MPKGMPIFQTFYEMLTFHDILWNAKGNFYTLLLCKKFYIILDTIVIPIICICIVHKNCILLHFYTLYHIKEKCVEFLLFEIFLFFSYKWKNKKTWFLYITSNKGFFEFFTAKTTKQNKEYTWLLWSSWIVICLSWRFEVWLTLCDCFSSFLATMFLSTVVPTVQ